MRGLNNALRKAGTVVFATGFKLTALAAKLGIVGRDGVALSDVWADAACLVGIIERGIDSLEVRQSVHDEYIKKVDPEYERLIWSHLGTNSYYRNKHGRVFTVLSWRFLDYWASTHDPGEAEYESAA